MMKLLFGGTAESTEILEFLSQQNIPVTTSVVSDYGRHLASKFGQNVVQGRMTADQMVAFIKENDVDEIIDASHPFADIVSQEAMKAANQAGIHMCALKDKLPSTYRVLPLSIQQKKPLNTSKRKSIKQSI